MSEPKTGYYKVTPMQNNPFEHASLAEIVEQLESCSYRCEAGKLELNLAFIELKRRADKEQESLKLNSYTG